MGDRRNDAIVDFQLSRFARWLNRRLSIPGLLERFPHRRRGPPEVPAETIREVTVAREAEVERDVDQIDVGLDQALEGTTQPELVAVGVQRIAVGRSDRSSRSRSRPAADLGYLAHEHHVAVFHLAPVFVQAAVAGHPYQIPAACR
jgi:hypothetical protein